jgi:arylsulfatase A-like enzyme
MTGRVFPLVLTVSLSFTAAGCGSGGTEAALHADVPLHLETALEAATITGSAAPAVQPLVEWNFDELQPDWKPLRTEVEPTLEPVTEQTDGVLRVSLDESMRRPDANRLRGAIFVDLPDWRRADWDHLLIRARASSGFRNVRLAFNLGPRTVPGRDEQFPVEFTGRGTRVFDDGGIHTYRLQVDWSGAFWGEWQDPWRQLVLILIADEPASIDILSVTAVSKAAHYGENPAGVMSLERDGAVRQALYMHAPGKLAYRTRVPTGGRLDFGMGVIQAADSVTFRVSAGVAGDAAKILFEETVADPDTWEQRSVDLSGFAGQSLDLSLEAESQNDGAVALWTAPTLSGGRTSDRPNVVLYVVDGLGWEYMSLYGYNLRTTPNLERLAREGAVFERAYSTSRWTAPSTVSLMTSLQHSVLGGLQRERLQLPGRVVSMAQRFHRAGFQTAVFTGNPWAGRIPGLGREVDVLRDWEMWGDSASSVRLQGEFWRWREMYPGQPYWTHFQTVDVHLPGSLESLGPFDGLYISAERRQEYMDWVRQLRQLRPGHWWRPTPEAFEEAGIDRLQYYEAEQKLYAEAVAHQDHQIGRFVAQLKAAGEWDNTIFVVTADHGQHESGLVMVDPPIPDGNHTHLRPEQNGIPLLIVWPGHIPGGMRFRDPVSLLDLLPTLLDLVGLPPAEMAQGRSLAPLLLGEVPESEWESQPVILDEFYVDPESGELQGWIEVVDGRWGASLEINPPVQPAWAGRGEYDDARGERLAPLLLFDLWNDPYCLDPVNEERPGLVEKYAELLEAQFEAHQALAEHVGAAGEEIVLTPEQLETLRSLGYIQD